MFNRPRSISSLSQLQNHLAKNGGESKGLHWEECVDVEQSDEWYEPVEGRYFLDSEPATDTRIAFVPEGSEKISSTLITEEEIMSGVVEVIARRKV